MSSWSSSLYTIIVHFASWPRIFMRSKIYLVDQNHFTTRTLFLIMLTLLLFVFPSSKSTFSQPFKEQYISEVVRIGSIIILHLSKAMKSWILHTMWCIFTGEAAGEIWNWSLLGVLKGKMNEFRFYRQLYANRLQNKCASKQVALCTQNEACYISFEISCTELGLGGLC